MPSIFNFDDSFQKSNCNLNSNFNFIWIIKIQYWSSSFILQHKIYISILNIKHHLQPWNSTSNFNFQLQNQMTILNFNINLKLLLQPFRTFCRSLKLQPLISDWFKTSALNQDQRWTSNITNFKHKFKSNLQLPISIMLKGSVKLQALMSNINVKCLPKNLTLNFKP